MIENKVMKRYLLVFLLMGFLNLDAQNLVPNNSFETYSSCPNAYSQLTRATSWTLVTNHTGTSDYFNTCGVSPVNTTTAFWGPQAPNTGNGYIGVLAWHSALPSGREYAQTILTSPLTAGQNYTVSLMASLGEICNYACALQIYFSAAPYVMAPAGSTAITAVTPQVAFATVATNKTGWTLLTYNYTATGGEQYLIVGNFRNDATTVLVPVGAGSNNQTYYYIDDMVVMPAPLPVTLQSFTAVCNNGMTEIHWSTSSEINNDYFIIEYSADGILYDEALRVNGAGNSNTEQNYSAFSWKGTGYYRLKQVDFNDEEEIFDPVFVSCHSDDGTNCPTISFSNQEFQLKIESESNDEMDIQLMDMNGKLISVGKYPVISGTNEVNIPYPLQATGLYILLATGKQGTCMQKVFLQ